MVKFGNAGADLGFVPSCKICKHHPKHTTLRDKFMKSLSPSGRQRTVVPGGAKKTSRTLIFGKRKEVASSNRKKTFGYTCFAYMWHCLWDDAFLICHWRLQWYLVDRVDRNRVIKVADFGLARFTEEKEYYRPIDRTRALPIKWMAIESMTEEIFTTKSDVVSKIAINASCLLYTRR